MFYKKVSVLGDNGSQLDLTFENWDKETDSGGYGVREWADNPVDESIVYKLNQAQTIKYRFDGKYQYTYDMSWNQRQAFKDIVDRYNTL